MTDMGGVPSMWPAPYLIKMADAYREQPRLIALPQSSLLPNLTIPHHTSNVELPPRSSLLTSLQRVCMVDRGLPK